jgi:hypothetical protein
VTAGLDGRQRAPDRASDGGHRHPSPSTGTTTKPVEGQKHALRSRGTLTRASQAAWTEASPTTATPINRGVHDLERPLPCPKGDEPMGDGRRRYAHGRATSFGVPRRVPGVRVTPVSGPEGPGARLGRRFPWRLGRCQGCFEVGSYLGHDLLGAADPRLPAALAAGVALAEFGSGRGSHGDLVPGDLLVDGDGHGRSDRSVMAEPTQLGNRSPNWPLGSWRAVGRGALLAPRQDARADRGARRWAPARHWSPRYAFGVAERASPSGTDPAPLNWAATRGLAWVSPFAAFCGWRLLVRGRRTLSRVVRTARPPSGAGWPARARRGALPTRRTQTTAGCRTPGGRPPQRAGWPP